MSPEERIERVVEMLEEDAVRLRGAVPWSTVLRVCETNGFNAPQIAEVRRRLIKSEVEIEGDEDSEEGSDEDSGDGTGSSTELQDPVNIDGDADIDILTAYLQDVGQCGLLSPESEKELMRRIRAGERAAEALAAGEVARDSTLQKLIVDGKRARAEFIQSNLRLVLYIAKQSQWPRGVELEDLVQDGNLGLMRAVERFEHNRGLRFATYAIYWIRAYMHRAVANNGRLVRIPEHMIRRMQKLRKAKKSLRREMNGQEPTVHDVALQLGWQPEMVQFIEDLVAATPLSLDRMVADESGMTVAEKMKAPLESRPDYVFAKLDEETTTKRVLATLPPKLRQILIARFGLEGRETEKTLQEVGDEYGVSRERIRQLEENALELLRKRLETFETEETQKLITKAMSGEKNAPIEDTPVEDDLEQPPKVKCAHGTKASQTKKHDSAKSLQIDWAALMKRVTQKAKR